MRRRLTRTRREQGWTLIEIMVVLAIIATLTAGVSVAIPAATAKMHRTTCAQHLNELGAVYQMATMEHPGRPAHDGAALFLSWRKSRQHIEAGSEETLLCAGDPDMRFPRTPEDQARWDDVDLMAAPSDLCSFAVRDFTQHPVRRDKGERRILACDRQGNDGRTAHHKGGLNVLFDNGSVKFLGHEQLGLTADLPIVVGPDSDHPLLSQVRTGQ